MKAVISVIGKDKVGILAMIANECANYNLNVLDVIYVLKTAQLMLYQEK